MSLASEDTSQIRRADRNRHRARVRLGFERFVRLVGWDRIASSASAPPEKEPEVDGGEVATSPPVHWSILVLPLVLSILYVVAAALFGASHFDTGASGVDGLVAFVLLGTLVLVAAWSTGQLYEDVTWSSSQAIEWDPDPWMYLSGGALVLLSGRVVQLVVFDATIDRPVRYFLGNLVVALVLSSIVAGPLYALARRYHLSHS